MLGLHHLPSSQFGNCAAWKGDVPGAWRAFDDDLPGKPRAGVARDFGRQRMAEIDD